jgi:site-specific DNA-methyltransferase (adenine-specific)
MSYVNILQGDCRELLKTIPDESVDSIVTDPPYELGFMGKRWDSSGIAYDLSVWRECLRVLKPGGHLLSFGGTRTYHRMTCAIEDAGFEIRDCIMWVYGSGFPKSHNLEGQWQGWGSALKPAVEPVVCARKPLIGTIAENVLAHGTGAINVEKCRVDACEGRPLRDGYSKTNARNWGNGTISGGSKAIGQTTTGRWPANLIHDGSPEVVELFPESKSTSHTRGALGTGPFSGIQKKRL